MADFGVGRVRVLVFMCVLGAAGRDAAPQTVGPAEALSTLPQLVESGSADKVASVFAEDVVWVNPDARGVLNGKEAVRAYSADLFGKFSASGSSLKIEHSQVSGTWATVVASFHANWTGRDGQKVEERSRWVSVLRRQASGVWQVSRMVWYPLAE